MATASTPTTATSDQTWTVADVCSFLHISRSTASIRLRTGRLPQPARLGHRLLWDPQAVRALVQREART